VELPAREAGLSGKDVFFFDASLNPAYKAGLEGTRSRSAGNLTR
jgi:hypothetical protein